MGSPAIFFIAASPRDKGYDGSVLSCRPHTGLPRRRERLRGEKEAKAAAAGYVQVKARETLTDAITVTFTGHWL